MTYLLRALSLSHALLAVLFAVAALALLVIAVQLGWSAFDQRLGRASALAVIEAVGVLAAAVVALQIAQTIAEEEGVRKAHVSGPTRVSGSSRTA
jgi:hypothetical protein